MRKSIKIILGVILLIIISFFSFAYYVFELSPSAREHKRYVENPSYCKVDGDCWKVRPHSCLNIQAVKELYNEGNYSCVCVNNVCKTD